MYNSYIHGKEAALTDLEEIDNTFTSESGANSTDNPVTDSQP